MLRIITIAFALIAAVAGTARGSERVALFADEGLTQTSLIDSEPRLVDIYVAQVDTDGSTGCSFQVFPSPGFTGVWVADTTPWVHVGTTQTGFHMAYGYCVMTTTLMVKMTYQMFGTSTCSFVRTGGIAAWSLDTPICDACSYEYTVPGDSLLVNCTVATEPSTWGKVKALYRN